jgi:hypothetical protein
MMSHTGLRLVVMTSYSVRTQAQRRPNERASVTQHSEYEQNEPKPKQPINRRPRINCGSSKYDQR